MGFLQSLECLCVVGQSLTATSNSNIVSLATADPASAKAKISGSCTISATATYERGTNASLVGVGSIGSKLLGDLATRCSIVGRGVIGHQLTMNHNLIEKLSVNGRVFCGVEKLAGEFNSFDCLEKLYPSASDIYNSGFIASTEDTFPD